MPPKKEKTATGDSTTANLDIVEQTTQNVNRKQDSKPYTVKIGGGGYTECENVKGIKVFYCQHGYLLHLTGSLLVVYL